MRIIRFRVQNYKSWEDTDAVQLGDGLNVIVGQNNSGKSALIEGISLNLSSRPHRSALTAPRSDSSLTRPIRLSIHFEFDPGEVLEILRELAIIFTIPSNTQDPELALREFKESMQNFKVLQAEFENGALTSVAPTDLWGALTTGYQIVIDQATHDLKLASALHGINAQSHSFVLMALANHLRTRIYLSHAEKFSLGQSSVSENRKLSSKAENLPQVLHALSTSDRPLFDEYVAYVSKVLPQIKAIIIPPIAQNLIQVKIWSKEPVPGRPDLAVPLSEGGTGVGQVLAILYLVVTSEYPQCILIDEPQSFLHPGAVRGLLEVFKIFKKHQYIIATHSPSILQSSTKVLNVRNDGVKSSIQMLNASETSDIYLALENLGAKLSDLFGADSIIWVEGKTEELCYRLIIRELSLGPFWGIEIVGVNAPGGFESRGAERIYDVYTSISKGRTIVPPAVGFIFDREQRSNQYCNDLIRKSKGRVHFLRRRMFENYLIVPRAIAFVYNQSAVDDIENINEQDVEKWFEENTSDKKFFTGSEIPKPFSEEWLEKLDSAAALKLLFKSISRNRLFYEKPNHGLALTKEILSNSPKDFNEIIVLIGLIGTKHPSLDSILNGEQVEK